jgi:hypothetical protein
MRTLILELWEELGEAELDLSVMNCVMDGSWPSAREQLTAALAKCPEVSE